MADQRAPARLISTPTPDIPSRPRPFPGSVRRSQVVVAQKGGWGHLPTHRVGDYFGNDVYETESSYVVMKSLFDIFCSLASDFTNTADGY